MVGMILLGERVTADVDYWIGPGIVTLQNKGESRLPHVRQSIQRACHSHVINTLLMNI